MSDQQAFNPQAMLANVGGLKSMIQRIRQKDGGIGSVEDELVLHRAINDLDSLADLAGKLQTQNQQLAEMVRNLQGGATPQG